MASQMGAGCSGQDELHFPNMLSVKCPQKCLRTAACQLQGPQRHQGEPEGWPVLTMLRAPGSHVLFLLLSGLKHRRAFLHLPACSLTAAQRGLTHLHLLGPQEPRVGMRLELQVIWGQHSWLWS